MAKKPQRNSPESAVIGDPALYVVATPIGNLQDISPRAVRVLSEVACVAAEDTRHSRRLLSHLGIDTPLVSLHEHNEERAAPGLVDRIAAGESIAVVSDAGTPLISDPGYRLVRAARERGLAVRVVPGPSAVTAALSVAGLPTNRFVFEGFLPSRPSARRSRLQELVREPRTLVLFEASHRVAACMADLVRVFGRDRPAAVCRELTKRFETVWNGRLGELESWLESDPDQQRGEFVLVVAGAPAVENPDLQAALDLARVLLDYLPASQAARAAARMTGVRRQDVYAALDDER